MTTTFPKKILLATDGSEDAALAAQAAVDLSRRTGAELHAAHVWHLPFGAWPARPEISSSYYELQAEEVLAGQVERIEELGGTVVESHLRSRAAVADELLYLAGEIDAGLLVMGSRGIGPLKRLAVGSVSEGVIHHAHLPVLLLRGGERAWPPGHIVVGEDGSGPSLKAGELAAAIGSLFGADLTLMRVYPEVPEVYEEGRRMNTRMTDDELRRAEKDLGSRVAELAVTLGGRPKITIAVGEAAAELVETAHGHCRESVLTVVGSRGLGPIKRFRLDSVSTKVLRAAEGPVLVCPGEV